MLASKWATYVLNAGIDASTVGGKNLDALERKLRTEASKKNNAKVRGVSCRL